MRRPPPPEAVLCEACGYVLSADGTTPAPPAPAQPGACPECGEPAPVPGRRDGPAWARGASPGSFARTEMEVLKELAGANSPLSPYANYYLALLSLRTGAVAGVEGYLNQIPPGDPYLDQRVDRLRSYLPPPE